MWSWGETARADRPPAYHSTKVPCFCGSQCFLHKYSLSKLNSFSSLQTISLQPARVLSTGLLSNPHIPAHSTSCTMAGIYPRLGVQGCGIDHLCRSHFILCTADMLFHSPLTAADVPLLSQLMSPSFEGISPDVGNFLSFNTLRGAGPIPYPLLSPPPFFLSFYPALQGFLLSFLVSKIFCK